MTSEELAQQVTDCIESIQSRIIGTGDQQYSRGDVQAIELKTNAQLIQEALEELDDLLVYCAMLRIRVANLRGAI